MERNDLIERLRECDQPLINQPLPFSQVRQRIRDAASALETDATTIASLSEALAEAEKKRAEDWQPIETAPKDGTEVLLFGAYPENDDGHPTLRVTAGFWCAPDPPVIGDCGGECRCPEYGEPEEPFWCSMHGGSDSGWMSTDGGFTTEWPPTHWRPLPAPPRDLSQGGQP